MNFDFEVFLILTVAVTGIISLVDLLVFAPRRRREKEAAGLAPKEPLVTEYAKAFFPVLFVILLVRSFLFEPFRIPSSSMMPTLLVGDFILVNKFTYGVRLPLVHTEVLSVGEPERGDVVVFRFPEDPSVDFIKRVIAIPGDEVQYRDKQLIINGQLIEHEPLGLYQGSRMFGARMFAENLLGREFRILTRPVPNVQGALEVPPGHYFVMGDNRDDSRDSRFWGLVPEENIVGRAELIWMSWDLGGDGIALDRVGQRIR